MKPTVHSVDGRLGQSHVRFETGRVAELSDAAVIAQAGETTILVTAVSARSVREGVDFFPLTVDVEERMYAAGKIPGSFFRREGRPTERAILSARLIDRPLRPSFPEGFRNEVHIVATILAVDQLNPADVLSINAASLATFLAGIPFDGPVGAVRLAHIGGDWVANPTSVELEGATFEIVVAGRRGSSGNVDILMVEAGATEQAFELIDDGATEVSEDLVAAGLEEAKLHIGAAIDLQHQLVAKAGRKEPNAAWVITRGFDNDVEERVRDLTSVKLRTTLSITDKLSRQSALDELSAEVTASLGSEFPGRDKEISAAFRALSKRAIRERIVKEGVRIDGRSPTEVRPIWSEVAVIPRVHGSAIFTRGQTQAITLTTVGMLRMEQMLDDLGSVESKRYMHHYNFPPFSTGETGFMRGPKRREIGHGALAERALLPVIPDEKTFPYAIRVVSEVVSSNGSTSMASVCGSSLSLMDAGVPIRSPVSGIAMGLIAHEGEFVTLTDILGAEDAYGDMDFKVAGTETMITALQLDTKIAGIPSEVLASALKQAREARLHVMDKIRETLGAPRDELSPNAPRVVSFSIPVDKIGEVIGPKGKKINEIIATTGVEVDIKDDGTILIGSTGSEAAAQARKLIEEIVDPRLPQVGERFVGTVVKITPFGAFVSLVPGRDGLVHISKLGGSIRLRNVEDAVSVGEQLLVEVTEIDRVGKISLTPVDVPPRVKELPADYEQAEPRSSRGPRERSGGDGGLGGRGRTDRR